MLVYGLLGTLGLWLVGALALRVAVVPPEVCPELTAPDAVNSALEAAAWIDRVQRPDGSYLYEYDADAGAEVPGYNVVRHAGVTMSLYQLAAEGESGYLATADRGLQWMLDHSVEYDGWTGLADLDGGTVSLGGNALLLAGLAQRRIATGDGRYDELMHSVARYILVMQQEDGSFLRTWYPSLGAPDPAVRSKYATGEAFWALTLMHRFFPDEGWDEPSRAVADYLSLYRDEVEDLDFPPWADQWAAYGLSEMADWPLNEANVTYARALAERFGFLVRVESRRTGNAVSDFIHGPRARAAGLGTWVEALGSLQRLSAQEPRLADLQPKLEERLACSAGMLFDRQVTAEEAVNYERPEIAEGAWFDEGTTRMDDQQHALSGLIRAEPVLAARDQDGQ